MLRHSHVSRALMVGAVLVGLLVHRDKEDTREGPAKQAKMANTVDRDPEDSLVGTHYTEFDKSSQV